jgi:hypothetical protein
MNVMSRNTCWLLLGLLAGCADTFAPANQVTSVRLLATSADLPYARPGETVTLRSLAVDGRRDKPRPLQVSYLPTICANPDDDDTSACFPAMAAGLPMHANLDASFARGDTVSFKVPADLIATHAPPRGGPPYGVAYAFVVACAGHIERIEPDPQYPTKPPLGCFDEAGRRLGRDDFVFGFARVYAFDELRNSNPTFESLTLDQAVVDETRGIEIGRCTAGEDAACPKSYLDVNLAAASQEPDPASSAPGLEYREQVWMSYFVTGGKMESDLSILYDSRDGKIASTRNALTTRSEPGDFTLYAILRDNRGGVSWKTYPLRIR